LRSSVAAAPAALIQFEIDKVFEDCHCGLSKSFIGMEGFYEVKEVQSLNHSVPPMIWFHIFSLLDVISLLRCARVSKVWKGWTRNDKLWFHHRDSFLSRFPKQESDEIFESSLQVSLEMGPSMQVKQFGRKKRKAFAIAPYRLQKGIWAVFASHFLSPHRFESPYCLHDGNYVKLKLNLLIEECFCHKIDCSVEICEGAFILRIWTYFDRKLCTKISVSMFENLAVSIDLKYIQNVINGGELLDIRSFLPQ
jgi:hypothetical protein